MSSQLSYDQGLWFSSQIYRNLSTIHEKDPLPLLEERLAPLYADRFPNTPWNPDTLRHCYQTRHDCIKKIETAQGPLDLPASGIDYSKLIKSTFRSNPSLHRSQHEAHLPLATHRKCYARALSRAAYWVEGRKFEEKELEKKLAAIQQHIIGDKIAAEFERDADPHLLFLFHFLALDLNQKQSPSLRQRDLIKKTVAFLLAAKKTELNSLILEMQFQAAVTYESKPEVLWPSLIGKEARLAEAFESVFQPGMRFLPGTEEISHQLLALAPDLPSNEEHPLLTQIRCYLICNDSFKKNFFFVPALLRDFIADIAVKVSIENPDDEYEERIERIHQCVVPLMAQLKQYDTIAPYLFHHFALQGTLEIADGQRAQPPLFERDCPLHQTLCQVCENYDHPLLHRAEIIESTLKTYLDAYSLAPESSPLVEKWTHHYFKFIWFNPPIGSFHYSTPKLLLYLEWLAAELLDKTPGLTKKDLLFELKKRAALELPDFPADNPVLLRKAIQPFKKMFAGIISPPSY